MKNLPASVPMSSEKSATEDEIIALMNALSLNYHRPPMSEGQLRVWLRTYCLDLAGRTRLELENACGRYRRDAANRFMATSGQIIELCREAKGYVPPRTIHGRLVDGRVQPWGGACGCSRCADKTPSQGFYRAPAEAYAASASVKTELDGWMGYQTERLPPVKPGEAMRDYRARRPASRITGGYTVADRPNEVWDSRETEAFIETPTGLKAERIRVLERTLQERGLELPPELATRVGAEIA